MAEPRDTRKGAPASPRAADDAPILPDTADEDRDAAWGDEPGTRDDEWYRRERPPHHE